MLPWVWRYPMKFGGLSVIHNNFASSRIYQYLTIYKSLVGPALMYDWLDRQSSSGPMQATKPIMRSWLQWPCHAQNILFLLSPYLPAVTFFCPLFSMFPSRRRWYKFLSFGYALNCHFRAVVSAYVHHHSMQREDRQSRLREELF